MQEPRDRTLFINPKKVQIWKSVGVATLDSALGPHDTHTPHGLCQPAPSATGGQEEQVWVPVYALSVPDKSIHLAAGSYQFGLCCAPSSNFTCLKACAIAVCKCEALFCLRPCMLYCEWGHAASQASELLLHDPQFAKLKCILDSHLPASWMSPNLHGSLSAFTCLSNNNVFLVHGYQVTVVNTGRSPTRKCCGRWQRCHQGLLSQLAASRWLGQ